MALKGSGKPLTGNPYGNPSGKTVKSSPYGKLPEKAKRKPKKNAKDTETTVNTQDEGVSLKEVFKVLGDENGRVTSAKLRSFVKELDLDFSDEEIREMIDVVDPSGKGEISYNNLVGVVRDFSHEFPSVQLTPEELSRELTNESEATKSDTTDENSEQPDTNAQNDVENNNDEETETDPEEQISRPMSSRARAAANAKKIIEEIDDRMSVIREDEEPEEDENEEKGEEKEEQRESDTEKENEQETREDVGENDEKIQDDDADKVNDIAEENKSLHSTAETVIVPVLVAEDEFTKDDDNTDDDNIGQDDRLSKLPSRASTVKEHRLDSAISTAVGGIIETTNEIENGRQSRKCSTSESSKRSRRDSVKSERSLGRKPNSRERSNSKTRQPDKRRKSGPRKRFTGSDDPEFYSTMGCSLKLSQIRTRQRLLYIMWRAIYDQAIRKMQQEQARQQNQKRKKLRNLKSNPSMNAI